MTEVCVALGWSPTTHVMPKNWPFAASQRS
jgi:hypothetical protein